ncbi:glycosyltransferase family 2 protein [Phenylobacterium sp.]|uniref:glycosyltransferase family 2 protein n=1 Tax=Phenylobacterium sp. TaxID=1871053 RepID=UPI0035C869E8
MKNVAAPNTRSRKGRTLSIVAPCYNEAQGLPLFFARLDAVLSRADVAYEVICVNDGSRDETLAVLLAHQQSDPRVKVLNLARNFGKDVALSAGLDAAKGDMVVPIDVDLQDPPELIIDFICAWEAGADVAVGVRSDRHSDSLLKRMTAGGFYRLFNAIADVPLIRNAGDFRLLDRRVVEVLRLLPERRRFMKGLFSWVGFRQVLIPYVRAPRAAGTSSWRYWRLWNFALDGFTAFSTAPLRVWTYLGTSAAVVALVYAAVIVVRTLFFGRDVPGYPSLMVALLLAFGLQMVAIGVLGEYLARIYEEVKARPLYVVMDRYGFDDPPA